PIRALARMGTTRLRHGEHVWSVFFAPDGKTVASGVADTMRIWEAATGKLVRSLRLGWGGFCGDGKTLAYWNNNHIELWDMRTGKQLRKIELKLEPDRQVFSLTISSNGKMVASFDGKKQKGSSGTVDESVRLWDLATGNPLRVLQGHGKSISSLFF